MPPTIPGAGVAGAEMVSELPADLALTVWGAYRSLRAWSWCRPDRRGGMFEPGQMAEHAQELARMRMDEELRSPLVLIAACLDEADPDVERIARACLGVTEWALARRCTATALDFAALAATVWSTSPRYAWLAGRLYREHGRFADAELWLKRAQRLAAHFGDHDTKARVLLTLGNLRLAGGSYPAAADLFRQALRFAQRNRLRAEEGYALHGLFTVAVATRDARAADEYSHEVVAAYGPEHPRLPHFAHDLACFWMEQGDFRNALDVLTSLLHRHFEDEPGSRIVVAASAARAAGACGEPALFQTFRNEVDARAAELGSLRQVAPALLEAARGAASLGLWSESEAMLDRAMDAAQASGQQDTVFQTEELRAAVRKRDGIGEVATPSQGRVRNRKLAQAAVASLEAVSAPSVAGPEKVRSPKSRGVAGDGRRRTL